MKHTPGPWSVEHHTLQDGKGGEKFAKVYAAKMKDGRFEDIIIIAAKLKAWTEEQEANAKLIALAPTMFDYIEYVDAKLEIEEIPFTFEEWKKLVFPVLVKILRVTSNSY